MSSENGAESIFLGTDPATAGATICSFSPRRGEGRRLRRLEELKYENELLTRVLSETQGEIVRLRKILARR